MIKMNASVGYANLALCSCERCAGEYILSVERMEKTGVKVPRCPYCGYKSRIIGVTTDENRAEIELDFLTLCEPLN